MLFIGSALSATLSSSCMPFLNALMPCATSPIRSEILPRPNSSRTTAITTIQCQMLSEPILQSSRYQQAGKPARSSSERRLGGRQKQGLRARQIGASSRGLPLPLISSGIANSGINLAFVPALVFRLHGWRERQIEIADLKGILVLAKRGIVGGRGNTEAARQARIHQSRALQFL